MDLKSGIAGNGPRSERWRSRLGGVQATSASRDWRPDAGSSRSRRPEDL